MSRWRDADRIGLGAAVSLAVHFAAAAALGVGVVLSERDASRARLDPGRKPPKEEITLGSAKSNAVRITWIGFEQETPHAGFTSEVEQAALSPDASPVEFVRTGAPTPSTRDGTESELSIPSPAAADPTESKPNFAEASAAPPAAEESDAAASAAQASRPDEGRGEDPKTGVQSPAPATTEPALGSDAAPEKRPDAPRPEEKSTDAGGAGDGPADGPAAIEKPINPAESDAAADSPTDPPQDQPSSETSAKKDRSPQSPENESAEQPAATKPDPEQPDPNQPTPKQTDPTQPSRPAPASTPAPSGATERASQPSEKESIATSIAKVLEYRPGQPLATNGLEIKTVRPRFSLYAKATSRPASPLVELRFNKGGRVVGHVMKRGSGYPTEVDQPVISALYRWRASGEQIEKLGEGKEIRVTIRVLLN